MLYGTEFQTARNSKGNFNYDGRNPYYSIMNFFFFCLFIHNLLKFIHYIHYPTSFPFNPVTTKDSINALVPGCCSRCNARTRRGGEINGS